MTAQEQTTHDNAVLKFADAFIAAIERGDVEAAKACYAPGAVIWHNFDNAEQSVDDNMKVLAWFARKLTDRHYRIVRREVLADGFLQQHVMEATLPDGRPFRMPACCVIRMKDGLITRLDEYLDSAQSAVLMEFRGKK
jgi:ketosteroid isomerase-like protein